MLGASREVFARVARVVASKRVRERNQLFRRVHCVVDGRPSVARVTARAVARTRGRVLVVDERPVEARATQAFFDEIHDDAATSDDARARSRSLQR